MENKSNKSDRYDKNGSVKWLAGILVAGVVFMFAFSYMMVPIFTYVCKQMGINGKGAISASLPKAGMEADLTRSIRVEFASVLHGNVGFKFIPLQKEITIHPGEHRMIYFYAENDSGMDKTVQAVPSITPADAARFLKKIECFCFTQQFFTKNEKADMFVNFYIDPAVPKNIKEITLSYTLFDATGFKSAQPAATKGRIRLSSYE